MRFLKVFMVCMAAVTVSADAWGDTGNDLAARSQYTYGSELDARSDGFIDERDSLEMPVERSLLVERGKIKVTISKKLKRGRSYKYDELAFAQEHGQAALKQFGYMSGEVMYANEPVLLDLKFVTDDPQIPVSYTHLTLPTKRIV